MKILIEAEPNEVADLVLEIQGRLNGSKNIIGKPFGTWTREDCERYADAMLPAIRDIGAVMKAQRLRREESAQS